MGWAGWFAAHGYLAVGGILFLSALGLPMPTVLALILAGAAMHSGTLAPLMVLLVAVAAENLGATALYVGGRATGWWLLPGYAASPWTRRRAFFVRRNFSTGAAHGRSCFPDSFPGWPAWLRRLRAA